MTDDELQQKVNNLRSTLNGGNFPSSGDGSDLSGSTGGNPVVDNTSVDRPKRGTGKDLRTTDSRTARRKALDSAGEGGSDGVKRKSKTVTSGVRSTTDGYDQDNSFADATRYDDQGVTTRGRLIRDEQQPPTREKSNQQISDIFTAIPHRRPGRPKKQEEVTEDRPTAIGPIKNFQRRTENWFTQGNFITETEANDLIKPISVAFVDYGGYIDQYARVKLRDPSLVFFSDLSYEEGEVLAKVLLRLGKRNAQIATATRTLAQGNDYISAVIILWPRISKLVEAIRPETATPRVRERINRMEGRAPVNPFRRVKLEVMKENANENDR